MNLLNHHANRCNRKPDFYPFTRKLHQYRRNNAGMSSCSAVFSFLKPERIAFPYIIAQLFTLEKKPSYCIPNGLCLQITVNLRSNPHRIRCCYLANQTAFVHFHSNILQTIDNRFSTISCFSGQKKHHTNWN